ncbi:putative glycoprotein [Nyavirus gerbillisci]|uniref:Glycoprotein n=1 Tax=Toure nyavirus TaxID=2994001 RepID=A0A9E8DA74_9MONO|nr:putative glycoprotein [Toure nyavirus]
METGKLLCLLAYFSFCESNMLAVDQEMSTPMLCPNHGGLTVHRLSDPINCKKLAGKSQKEVALTLYKKNLRLWETPAVAVFKERKTCTSTCYFFGAEEKVETPVLKVSILQLEATEIQHGMCTTTHGRKTMKNGEYSDSHDCSCSWTGTWNYDIERCKLQNGSITISHGGLMFSGLGPVTHCNYQSGICELPDKQWLFWKPNPIVRAEYVEAGNYTGTLLENHILIDELQESLVIDSNCKENTLCNTTTGMQVIYKSIQKPHIDNVGIQAVLRRVELVSYLQTLRERLAKMPKGPTRHSARSYLMHLAKTWKIQGFERGNLTDKALQSDPPLDPRISQLINTLREEILEKLQFLIDAISPSINLVDPICHQIARHETQLRLLATAHPTQYVRSVYETPFLAGTTSGNYIGVWPCLPVLDYEFDKPGSICYKNPPIRYRTEKETPWITGYLELETNIIRRNSAELPCNSVPTELTMRGKRLYLYRDGLMKEIDLSQVKTLPSIDKNADDGFLITWNNTWVYNQTDYLMPNPEGDIYQYISEKIDKGNKQYQGDTNQTSEADRNHAFNFPTPGLGFPWNLFGWITTLIHYAGLIALVLVIILWKKNANSGNTNFNVNLGEAKPRLGNPFLKTEKLDSQPKTKKKRVSFAQGTDEESETKIQLIHAEHQAARNAKRKNAARGGSPMEGESHFLKYLRSLSDPLFTHQSSSAASQQKEKTPPKNLRREEETSV